MAPDKCRECGGGVSWEKEVQCRGVPFLLLTPISNLAQASPPTGSHPECAAGLRSLSVPHNRT